MEKISGLYFLLFLQAFNPFCFFLLILYLCVCLFVLICYCPSKYTCYWLMYYLKQFLTKLYELGNRGHWESTQLLSWLCPEHNVLCMAILLSDPLKGLMLEATNDSFVSIKGVHRSLKVGFQKHSQCLLQQLGFTVNLRLKASSAEVNRTAQASNTLEQ